MARAVSDATIPHTLWGYDTVIGRRSERHS